jgi:hypothetical protein
LCKISQILIAIAHLAHNPILTVHRSTFGALPAWHPARSIPLPEPISLGFEKFVVLVPPDLVREQLRPPLRPRHRGSRTREVRGGS